MTLDRRSLLGAMAAGLASPAWSRTPPSAMERLFLEGRYLPRYLELRAQAQAGDSRARNELFQFAALVGDERTALARESPTYPEAPPDLSRAAALDGIQAITERAANAQVVILNEAHHVSGHRAFAAQVLRALRPLGFDTFAAETFVSDGAPFLPSIADFRAGAPFLGLYGYYSRDPVFAEAVRDAASLGYRFAAYEMRQDQEPGPEADMRERIRVREEAQARNLMEVLEARPDARMFVLVGYGHASEAEERVSMFAAQFKRMSGIDPLTVEQSANWPALDPAGDAPHVAAVLDRFRPERPISVELDGRMYAAPDYLGRLDMAVFHPRRAPVDGRPGWLAADPQRIRVEVEVPAFEGPALIQAMHVLEGPAGVPADQFPLEPGQSRAVLFLRPGRYFVRLELADGVGPAWTTVTADRPGAA